MEKYRSSLEASGLDEDELKELIGDLDYDIYYGSQAHPGSLSSEQLLKKILTDSHKVVFASLTENDGRNLASLVGIILLPFAVLAIVGLLTMSLDLMPPILSAFSLMSLVGVLVCAGIVFRKKRAFSIFSRYGVASNEFRGTHAIEWDHVEFIDVWRKDDETYCIEFYGN
ncbi:MAG: hypothetical protein GF411_15420 [Candidatus Lokiarchaeota archaeon]|nr:hypothetical protein [Candidatus Lokiarchaeota archaeon]